jgi:hypothetical protein
VALCSFGCLSGGRRGISDRLTRRLPESNVQNLPDVVADASAGVWILDVVQDWSGRLDRKEGRDG